MRRTREKWQEEIKKIREMDAPEEKKVRLYYNLSQEMNKQIIEEEGEGALGYIPDENIILSAPVLGTDMTYGELCRREHLDWLTGKPILD